MRGQLPPERRCRQCPEQMMDMSLQAVDLQLAHCTYDVPMFLVMPAPPERQHNLVNDTLLVLMTMGDDVRIRGLRRPACSPKHAGMMTRARPKLLLTINGAGGLAAAVVLQMPHDRGLTGALIMFLNPIGPPDYVVDNWRHPVDVTATYSGYDVIVAVGEIPMDGGPDLGPERWGLLTTRQRRTC